MTEESIDVVAFQRGDVKTFEEIYHGFYTYVMYFARKMTGNEAVAEEIAMDAFRKLWTRRTDFDNKNSIKAWLMITTKNACLTHLYQERRRNELIEGYKHQELQRQADEDKSHNLLQENVVHILHEEINKLPPRCRVIIQFRIEGYSNREIAKLMNISVQTVRNQATNSFKKLKMSFFNIEQLVLFLLALNGFF